MIAIDVVGSINLDLVASGARLPAPGETVTGATLARHPGGKGANQALAAARLGATVRMFGRVGADPFAEEALALLRAGGVDLAGVGVDPAAPTGVALIAVSPEAENQIVVAPGANAACEPKHLPERFDGALICQLELPVETVAAAAARATGLVVLNLAPAAPVPEALLARADLIVVNETEAAFYGSALEGTQALVALTLGARGAVLRRGRSDLARAEPPRITPVDTTGAGDAFVGALAVALAEGQPHGRALAFACAAGAAAATRPGAQPSLPLRREVEALMEPAR
ncbi:MAG: ribokinase [Phenylobacterium sp.]|uniref:ribokinase n=1 Tax=Phenylobacterium sp. TaxID=1871053 RepID=UPI00391C6463